MGTQQLTQYTVRLYTQVNYFTPHTYYLSENTHTRTTSGPTPLD